MGINKDGSIQLDDSSITAMDNATKNGYSPSEAAKFGVSSSNTGWVGGTPDSTPTRPAITSTRGMGEIQHYSAPTTDYNQPVGMSGQAAALTDQGFKQMRLNGTGTPGLAAGGQPPKSKAGIIPGKRNDKVADDTLIKAKKGEYIIPTEALDIYGAAFFDRLVKQAKKMKGVPAVVGPKTGNTDSQGRKDAGAAAKANALGFAKGGWFGALVPDADGTESGANESTATADNPYSGPDRSGRTMSKGEYYALPADQRPMSRFVPTASAPAAAAPAQAPAATAQQKPALPAAVPPVDKDAAAWAQTEKDDALEKSAYAAGQNNPAIKMDTVNRPTFNSPVREDAAAMAKRLLANYQGGPVLPELSIRDAAFVGKANMNNPSYKNAMAAKAVHESKLGNALTQFKAQQDAAMNSNKGGVDMYQSNNALEGHNNAATSQLYGADKTAATHKYTADMTASVANKKMALDQQTGKDAKRSDSIKALSSLVESGSKELATMMPGPERDAAIANHNKYKAQLAALGGGEEPAKAPPAGAPSLDSFKTKK